MSILTFPRQIAKKIVGAVGPVCADSIRSLGRQPEENDALRHRLDQVEGDLRELQSTVATLNRDLDESRRLNLRAAEIMDIAFSELAK